MKRFSFMVVFLSCSFFAVSQKPLIDSSVFGNWPGVVGTEISANGRYVFFFVDNQPAGNRTLVIKDTRSSWEYSVEKGSDASFTRDCRSILFRKDPDSLILLELGGTMREVIPRIVSFKLSETDKSQWLAYESQGGRGALNLRNLTSGENRPFDGISEYQFTPDGNAILVEQRQQDSSKSLVKEIDLLTGDSIKIWGGTHATNFVIGPVHGDVAFMADSAPGSQAIWLFKQGEHYARMVVGEDIKRITPGYIINSISSFSKDGARLFIGLKRKIVEPGVAKGVGVDVWRYKDAVLQSEQLRDLNPNNIFGESSREYEAVVDLDTHSVRQLQGAYDLSISSDAENSYELLSHRDLGEERADTLNKMWAVNDLILVDTRSGKRTSITKEWGAPFLSPKGDYVVYYDKHRLAYYSFETATGAYRNLTKDIAAVLTSDGDFGPSDPQTLNGVIGVAGWLKDGSVLLYDRFDIWKVDPAGRRSSRNITGGFGRRHGISFRLAILNNYSEAELADSANLLLCAFNKKTKDNGFYAQDLASLKGPQLLTMGPYVYSWKGMTSFVPVKAKDTSLWLVQRMSAGESPNYYLTSDFSTFERLSNVKPEAKYNWLTTELVSWMTPDGKTSQGILYKPEDFDPKKKYPIIFYYYEQFSDELNLYRPADVSTDRLNIPFFVSNGYLVFIPDIHYRLGVVGQSAVNAVVSAAKFLAAKPWVDAAAMGLQGHSFGGYETNYIISHTNIFAAAVSASGISDCISDYGTIAKFGGQDRAGGYLVGHEGIRTPLWQRPDLYIKNSPLFSIKVVSTPLLMMSNKDDGIIDYSQGIEFYLALRQLGKKVWLLQYDGEGHNVYGDAAKDYTERMVQFFGYYLKGLQPPRWMVKGVPAFNKGIDLGFEYDNTGKKP